MRRVKNFCNDVSFIEFGFLWSIFFAPWGPALRYLGWLIIIAALLREGWVKEKKNKNVLDYKVGMLFLTLILLGLVSTFITWNNLHLIIKGFSRLLEFLFSLWIAANVFQKKGAIVRFSTVWQYSIAFSIVHTIIGILIEPGSAGMFSNIDTLGQYATLVFPFSLILVLGESVEGNKLSLGFHWFMFLGSAFMIFISFSSIAWITGVFSLFLILFFLRPDPKKSALSLMVLLLTGMTFIVGMMVSDTSLGVNVRSQMLRELKQLVSVDDIHEFSNNREIYWNNAVTLIRLRPVLGWGWVNAPLDEKLSAVESEQLVDVKGLANTAVPGHAHNMYLNLAVYGGIPCLFIILFLHLLSLWRSYFMMNRFPEMKVFYGTVFVTVFSQLLYNLAGDIFNFRYKAALIFWTMMGLALRNLKSGESESNV